LAGQDPVFHKDIEEEFISAARREVADEIATSLNLNPEQVAIITEKFDVWSFLNESQLEKSKEKSPDKSSN